MHLFIPAPGVLVVQLLLGNGDRAVEWQVCCIEWCLEDLLTVSLGLGSPCLWLLAWISTCIEVPFFL